MNKLVWLHKIEDLTEDQIAIISASWKDKLKSMNDISRECQKNNRRPHNDLLKKAAKLHKLGPRPKRSTKKPRLAQPIHPNKYGFRS